MKDKNVAAVLAFFLGTFGVHRFYLGQTWLGIFYCIFAMTGISAILGFIDAIAFFAMNEEKFDVKYNWKEIYADRYREDRRMSDRERQRIVREERMQDRFEQQRKNRERDIEHWQRRHRHRAHEEEKVRKEQEHADTRAQKRAQLQKITSFKAKGIESFKEYDYQNAIEAFNKVIEIDNKDVATHFNLACAYSLNEETDQAFYHLDQAVANGFDDFDKIKTHDALAFLRIQSSYETFAANKYRLPQPEQNEQTTAPPAPEQEEVITLQDEMLELGSPQPNLLDSQPDLLDQLQKLGDLRAKGVLSEEEFNEQKRKLLG